MIPVVLVSTSFLVPTDYLTEAIRLAQLPPPIRAKAEAILPIAQESHARPSWIQAECVEIELTGFTCRIGLIHAGRFRRAS